MFYYYAGHRIFSELSYCILSSITVFILISEKKKNENKNKTKKKVREGKQKYIRGIFQRRKFIFEK